jgi:hypothetical protein
MVILIIQSHHKMLHSIQFSNKHHEVQKRFDGSKKIQLE